MTLAELPDDFTHEQFKSLDKASLDKIPYDRLHWLCQCKNCENGTHVRNYGLGSWFFLDRNSQAAAKHPEKYWMGMGNYWLCGKHNKIFKRLGKSFPFQQIWDRFIDKTKNPIY